MNESVVISGANGQQEQSAGKVEETIAQGYLKDKRKGRREELKRLQAVEAKTEAERLAREAADAAKEALVPVTAKPQIEEAQTAPAEAGQKTAVEEVDAEMDDELAEVLFGEDDNSNWLLEVPSPDDAPPHDPIDGYRKITSETVFSPKLPSNEAPPVQEDDDFDDEENGDEPEEDGAQQFDRKIEELEESLNTMADEQAVKAAVETPTTKNLIQAVQTWFANEGWKKIKLSRFWEYRDIDEGVAGDSITQDEQPIIQVRKSRQVFSRNPRHLAAMRAKAAYDEKSKLRESRQRVAGDFDPEHNPYEPEGGEDWRDDLPDPIISAETPLFVRYAEDDEELDEEQRQLAENLGEHLDNTFGNVPETTLTLVSGATIAKWAPHPLLLTIGTTVAKMVGSSFVRSSAQKVLGVGAPAVSALITTAADSYTILKYENGLAKLYGDTAKHTTTDLFGSWDLLKFLNGKASETELQKRITQNKWWFATRVPKTILAALNASRNAAVQVGIGLTRERSKTSKLITAIESKLTDQDIISVDFDRLSEAEIVAKLEVVDEKQLLELSNRLGFLKKMQYGAIDVYGERGSSIHKVNEVHTAEVFQKIHEALMLSLDQRSPDAKELSADAIAKIKDEYANGSRTGLKSGMTVALTAMAAFNVTGMVSGIANKIAGNSDSYIDSLEKGWDATKEGARVAADAATDVYEKFVDGVKNISRSDVWKGVGVVYDNFKKGADIAGGHINEFGKDVVKGGKKILDDAGITAVKDKVFSYFSRNGDATLEEMTAETTAEQPETQVDPTAETEVETTAETAAEQPETQPATETETTAEQPATETTAETTEQPATETTAETTEQPATETQPETQVDPTAETEVETTAETTEQPETQPATETETTAEQLRNLGEGNELVSDAISATVRDIPGIDNPNGATNVITKFYNLANSGVSRLPVTADSSFAIFEGNIIPTDLPENATAWFFSTEQIQNLAEHADTALSMTPDEIADLIASDVPAEQTLGQAYEAMVKLNSGPPLSDNTLIELSRNEALQKTVFGLLNTPTAVTSP